MKIFRNKYLIFISVFSIFLIGFACIGFLDKSYFGSIFAQNNQAQTKKTEMSVRENTALDNLNSLLSGEGISVDEAFMLPQRIAGARKILVRLEAAEKSLTDSEFASQLSTKPLISLIETKKSGKELARQRNLELSPTLILIVAVNDDREMLWWNLQPDPRIVRAEAAEETGKLSQRPIFYRNNAEMLIAVPSDNAIRELRFYHPNWNGQDYDLEKIGSLEISQNAE